MFVKMHRVMCFIVTALLILLQITCQNNVEVQFVCKNEECSGKNNLLKPFGITLNFLFNVQFLKFDHMVYETYNQSWNTFRITNQSDFFIESIGEFAVKLTYTPDSPEKIAAKAKDRGIILARPIDASIKLWKVKVRMI